METWKRVKANKGSSGMDGIRIEDIEAHGVCRYLTEIQRELIGGVYIPSPVKIAIEPVFEADFKNCSYGFRPKRSAKQAIEVVRKACNSKGYYVVNADIEKFFDNVNQDKMMKLVEQRISDRKILKLIRQWLKTEMC